MYTLRKISENRTCNHSLGDSYSLVTKNHNKKDFDYYYESVFGENEQGEKNSELFAFIIADTIHPIFKDESVYIMTESGKTFECIRDI